MDGHNINNNNNTFNSEQSWLNFFLPFFNGTSNRPPSRCPKNSKLLFWTFWTNFLFPLSLTLSLSLLARVVVNVSKATFSLLLCLYVCTPHPTYMISFSVLFAFMHVYCFSTYILFVVMSVCAFFFYVWFTLSQPARYFSLCHLLVVCLILFCYASSTFQKLPSLSLSSTYSFALSSCCTSLPMYVISSGTSIIAYLSFCLFDFDLYWIFSLSLSAKSLSSWDFLLFAWSSFAFLPISKLTFFLKDFPFYVWSRYFDS